MAVGVAFTTGFLALALRNVHLGAFWEVLRQAKGLWILAMSAVVVFDLAIRAWRWQILLSQSAKSGFAALFRLESIGLAINNVLFMRLGELARAVLAGRELSIPMGTAVSSVAVERALDMAALLLLFLAAGLAAPVAPLAVRRGAIAVLAILLAALIGLSLSGKRLEPGGSWERRVSRWPKLRDLLMHLAAGARVLREPKACLAACLLSLALWSCDALLYWCGARALGLGHAMDYPTAVLALSWAGVGAALPAAPGAFGTLEAMVKSLMVELGVAPHSAFAYAFFCHMIGYGIVTLLGLAFLYRIGLSLGELKAALGQEAPRS